MGAEAYGGYPQISRKQIFRAGVFFVDSDFPFSLMYKLSADIFSEVNLYMSGSFLTSLIKRECVCPILK